MIIIENQLTRTVRRTFKKKNGSKGSGVRPSHFKLNIGDRILDDNRDLIVLDRYLNIKPCKAESCVSGYSVRTKKFYVLQCNKCTASFNMEQSNLLHRKDNCPCCSGKRVFYGINDLSTLRPDLVKYFKNPDDAKNVTLMSNKKVKLVCPLCKTEKMLAVSVLTSYKFTCSECSDGISYPNKFSYCFLKQLPVYNIIHEFVLRDNNKLYRYDNYFEYNNQGYILEMDGEQHYQDISFYNKYRNNKEIDNVKNGLALNHGYQVIHVDCSRSEMDFIRTNILNSELDQIFDLSKIDWEQCEIFASKNIFHDCVQLFNQGMGNKSIASKLDLHISNVNSYFRKARRLNLVSDDIIIQNKNLFDKYNHNVILKWIKEYIETHPLSSTSQIAQDLGYNKYQLRRFLKLCTQNKELDFDFDQEIISNRAKSNGNLVVNPKKTVYVYDCNKKYYGQYDSGVDAIKNNPNMMWTVKGIQKVCTGYQQTHKGYYFSYTPLFTELADKL